MDYTTHKVGEEDTNTTLALGEEDLTTHAVGEEEATTHALGEEGPYPTTLREGEEDDGWYKSQTSDNPFG